MSTVLKIENRSVYEVFILAAYGFWKIIIRSGYITMWNSYSLFIAPKDRRWNWIQTC